MQLLTLQKFIIIWHEFDVDRIVKYHFQASITQMNRLHRQLISCLKRRCYWKFLCFALSTFSGFRCPWAIQPAMGYTIHVFSSAMYCGLVNCYQRDERYIFCVKLSKKLPGCALYSTPTRTTGTRSSIS